MPGVPSPRQLLVYLFKIAVTAGLLWYFLKDVDFPTVGAHFAKLGPASLALIVVLLFIQLLIFSLRWFLVAGGTVSALSLADSIKISFIAFFFTFTVPIAMGGDISRVYYLNKSQKQLSGSVSVIFTDRLIGLLAIAVLMTTTYPAWVGLVSDEKLSQTLKVINLLAVAGLFLTPVILYVLRNRDFTRFPLIAGLADRISTTMRLRLVILLLALSLVIQACSLAIIAVITTAMDVPVHGLRELLLVVPVMIAGALPVSFGGWGIREGAMVLALAQLGIAAESALAVSVMFGLSLAVIGAPGIVFWMMRGSDKAGE